MTPKPLKTPAPLTPDELERLARYDATPFEDRTEDEVLDEITLNSRRKDWSQYRMASAIRHLLPIGPDGRAADVPRGRFTRVVEASPFKREYVARIRDGLAVTYVDGE